MNVRNGAIFSPRRSIVLASPSRWSKSVRRSTGNDGPGIRLEAFFQCGRSRTRRYAHEACCSRGRASLISSRCSMWVFFPCCDCATSFRISIRTICFLNVCTEPERYDHKVFGRLSRTLCAIQSGQEGRRPGEDRRSGWLAATPLARSLLDTSPYRAHVAGQRGETGGLPCSLHGSLRCVGGALEGAWWGPFVCHREGLIDEGDFPYPSMERITHYASVRGRVGELRERPALHALAAFNALIPGWRLCRSFEQRRWSGGACFSC